MSIMHVVSVSGGKESTATLMADAARKRLATLQAAAPRRGFVVQALSDGGYMVSRGLWLRDVEDNATSYQTRQRGLEEGAIWASGSIAKLGANSAPSEGWRAKVGIR